MNAPISNKPRIEANLARPTIRIVIVGHVDHGKSTLIGRLLHETGSLPDGKLGTLKTVSARRGMPFEWSFLLDSLQAERNQGITIDTSQIRFRTPSREFVLIDAPGHAEFLRNMITGAAEADAAVLIVDATEGVRDQTRRHGYLLHLLGVRQLAVVVNKMDRVEFDETRFREIEVELNDYLGDLGLTPTAVIPISARQGDGVARRSPGITWYQGPTVLEALDHFAPAHHASDLALRFPVQAIYKFDDRRIIAGRLESGRITVGDEIVILPAGKTAQVKSIEAWPEHTATRSAVAGQSVGITLDRELFLERGDVIALANTPASSGRLLRARMFWLHPDKLDVGDRIVARIGTGEARGEVIAIDNAVDPGKLAPIESNFVAQNHVGEVELILSKPLATDPYTDNPTTGRVVIERDGRIAGGGLILEVRADDPRIPVSAAKAPRKTLVALDQERQDRVSQEQLIERASELNKRLTTLSPAERLIALRAEIAGRIVFTTSFGLEDQLITHLLFTQAIDADVVTLDTGRLFPQTYDLWAETERHYGKRIRAVYPNAANLEALVARQGINGFYESRDARLACCHVRKVEPLNRLLDGAEAWITGLRADQSSYREAMSLVTADTTRGLIKLSPLFDWTRDQALDFARDRAVPINPLHQQGFASIGCAPCTRAIKPGEPERAGRWWWEEQEKTECGLHERRASAG